MVVTHQWSVAGATPDYPQRDNTLSLLVLGPVGSLGTGRVQGRGGVEVPFDVTSRHERQERSDKAVRADGRVSWAGAPNGCSGWVHWAGALCGCAG